MPHKQSLFRSTAREKILCGVTALADAVRFTPGPKFQSVLIRVTGDITPGGSS